VTLSFAEAAAGPDSPGLSPDREVPDDRHHHNRCPRPHPARIQCCDLRCFRYVRHFSGCSCLTIMRQPARCRVLSCSCRLRRNKADDRSSLVLDFSPRALQISARDDVRDQRCHAGGAGVIPNSHSETISYRGLAIRDRRSLNPAWSWSGRIPGRRLVGSRRKRGAAQLPDLLVAGQG
jgi:hypothetical protein